MLLCVAGQNQLLMKSITSCNAMEPVLSARAHSGVIEINAIKLALCSVQMKKKKRGTEMCILMYWDL